MPSLKTPVDVAEEAIIQTAKRLIEKYGEGAELEAAIEVDKFIARGDPEGERTWMRILQAIRELQSPRPGDTVH